MSSSWLDQREAAYREAFPPKYTPGASGGSRGGQTLGELPVQGWAFAFVALAHICLGCLSPREGNLPVTAVTTQHGGQSPWPSSSSTQVGRGAPASGGVEGKLAVV